MSSSFLPRRAIVMGRRRPASSASTATASQQAPQACQIVGKGNPQAELVFVGAGPDEQEGAPGQLLDRMIQAMGLQSEQVYICNVVQCSPGEIAACSPLLARELDVIRPKIVVALGELAAQMLLQTEDPISTLRGSFHPYRHGAKLMPTFHPGHLIRNPESKREAWEHLQQVAAELGIKIPKRS